MKTYRHSGTLGDLIYSLSIVKKIAQNDVYFDVAINNIENCVAQYGYRPDEVALEHRGRFTEKDFEWLLPLLRRQPYIETVRKWYQGDPEPDVDLDRFRGTLFRGFEGNYVEAYHKAFNIPFQFSDYINPWLEADPIKTKQIVVSRTSRYLDPAGDAKWREIVAPNAEMAVFVGTEKEHSDFEKTIGTKIDYRPVNDFLELAGIVAGAELVCANQNFVYSLAIGLGKATVLETIKIKPLQMNECYFPRDNTQYF
jgi:hypothetical protein